MEKYVVKKSIIATLYVLFSLAIEAVAFLSLGMGVLPMYWLLDILSFVMIAFILFLLPLKLQKALSVVFLLIHTILSVVNIILFASTGRIFDWSMMLLIGEAAAAMEMVVIPILPVVIESTLCLIFLCLMIFLFNAYESYYKSFIKKATTFVFIGFICVCVAAQSLIQNSIIKKFEEENYFTSDSFEFATFQSPYLSLKRFGFAGYYANSLARIVLPFLTPVAAIDIKDCSYEQYVSELQGVCRDDNVIVILAESFEDYAISKELTPTLYALKNGININSVGINNFYDVEVLPNGQKSLIRKDYLYDGGHFIKSGVDIFNGLEEDVCGLEIVNYKSAEATNRSEWRVVTGSYFSVNNALPKMMQSSGYKTQYIHGNWGSFYNRNKQVPGLFGFEDSIFYGDMQNNIESTGELGCFVLDSDIANYYTANPTDFDFSLDEKFLTFYMTITTHGHYKDYEILTPYYEFLNDVSSFSEDGVLGCYKNLNDEELKSTVKNYLSKAIDTERAVSLLIDDLYNGNKLEDTTLVFVSDHNAYSNNIIEFKKLYYENVLEKDWSGEADAYNVPFFIYSTKLNETTITDYNDKRVVQRLSCAFDVVPTLLTLLDINYNKDVYMGTPLINVGVESGEMVYNKVTVSTTNNFYMGEEYITYDGIEIESDYEISNNRKKEIQFYVNKYKARELHCKYMITI